MKFYILRHASSLFNEGDRTLHNPGLSENGKRQANEIKGFYDIVVTSNLRRAKETLQYSNITYNRVIENDLMREVRGDGQWDYLEKEPIKPETDADINFRARVAKEYLAILQTQNPDAKILVISHAFFICRLFNRNMMLHNCQLLELDM